MTTDPLALLRSIAAYVPQSIAQRLVLSAATRPSVSSQFEERKDSVFLFADISGFTAMSEALSRVGKEGAEALTSILNTYFATMIDLVRSYGGDVIQFSGDALTCQFDGLSIARPCACALAMEDKMADFRQVRAGLDTFELKMKIGVSSGRVLTLSVGTPDKGLTYVLAGKALDRMAEAEHHASAGEVVIDGECAQLAGGNWIRAGIMVGSEREGFYPVRSLSRAVDRSQLAGLFDGNDLSHDAIRRAIRQLEPYLPPSVCESIHEGQRQFVGEHRAVSSLFVNFSGLDYDNDPQAGDKLQTYFCAMQQVIHNFGGRLNWISTGDKGSLLHLIFGAPLAYEDNEARAVGCALEMQEKTGSLPFITGQRIGIASGFVFAGDVGSEDRRAYTVMGDVVNLSARLMQAAGQAEILMDQHTARRSASDFNCQELPPIKVKGKQEPIPVYRPAGKQAESTGWAGPERQAGRSRPPIVGRDLELAKIQEIIQKAAGGRGQLLVITGEAGVGKSRLLEELVRLARQQGMQILGADCLSYGSQTPYLPWISFMNTYLGLQSGDGLENIEKLRRIQQVMEETDPDFKDWTPLVAQLLGLPADDTPVIASLSAQQRKQRLFEIILSLLRRLSGGAPRLVIFEDIHWADAISLELLTYVARNIGSEPILLTALHRPTIEMDEWIRFEFYNQIELVDLPVEDALKLVQYKLGMPQVPEALRERVLHGETRVNPFFVEEVLNSLIDRGFLAPGPAASGYQVSGDLSKADIPDSIQALVMSRIDRLDESSKLTVKVASVIGRMFPYLTLQAIYPVEVRPEKLRENLDRLSKLDLTPLDRPEPDWVYIFKHAITQEVAYQSLLFVHRRELHHRVGDYLEKVYAQSTDEVLELLAHHYYTSGDGEKSWPYLLRAGDKARAKFANESAIAAYLQALSLKLSMPDLFMVHISLGDVYQLTGEFDQSIDQYRQALNCAPERCTDVADIQRRIAKTCELQGKYDESMRWMHLAQEALSQAPDTIEMAHVYSQMGWVAVQTGEYDEALHLTRESQEIVERLPQNRETVLFEAKSQTNLGVIYLRKGDYDLAAEHLHASIELETGLSDLPGISRSYNNLAVIYYSQGNMDLAAEYTQKSMELSQKMGDTYGTAMCLNNLGGIAFTLGNYASAVEYYERSLKIRKRIGDQQGIADTYNNLGEVYHAKGDLKLALHYLLETVNLLIEIGDKVTLVDTYKLLAETALEMNDPDEALKHCTRSLDIALEIESQEAAGVIYRVMGRAFCCKGDASQGLEYLRQSVEALSTKGNRLELGRSSFELGAALKASDPTQARQLLQDAAQIFEEAGVSVELEKAREALKPL